MNGCQLPGRTFCVCCHVNFNVDFVPRSFSESSWLLEHLADIVKTPNELKECVAMHGNSSHCCLTIVVIVVRSKSVHC